MKLRKPVEVFSWHGGGDFVGFLNYSGAIHVLALE